MIEITFLVIIIAIIAYTCYKRYQCMTVLKRNGIPGPKPSLLWGNIFEYFQMTSIEVEEDWIGKYGKIVGFYMGTKPSVLVADPDLVKHIHAIDFNVFSDNISRVLAKDGIAADPEFYHNVATLRGQRWRDVRSVLTPTFSPSKLKTMTPVIEEAIDEFMHNIDKRSKAGNQFDIYDMFQTLTTDVIGRTALGIQTNVQNDKNCIFLNASKALLNMKVNRLSLLLIQCFPLLDPLIHPFRRFAVIIERMRGQSPIGIIANMVSDAIELRQHNPNNRQQDLLQLMLDTKTADKYPNATKSRNASNNSVHKNINIEKSSITLTDTEIIYNSLFFYVAGYETTSATLAYVVHILVNYPDIQERLREEIRQLLESEGKLDINVINRLVFMECVVNETLRLYPPLISQSRQCSRDYKYGSITIPKGANVHFAVHHLHHSPDYWPETDRFDPMRFSADRKHEIHPNSWLPFGSGPRMCVGMKFALLEIKLCLAKLLLSYRLIPGPNTEIGELSTTCKLLTLIPTNGVYVKIVNI